MLLLRLLGNLIDNAIRYTPSGSVEVTCEQAGDTLIIEVRDTGIGIPREQIEAIWEEFHQVGNPERNRNNGIGLGLAIVRRLSGILRHPVRVQSTHGQGSVFSVSVPLVATEKLPVPEQILPKSTPNTAPVAVLLAQTPSALQGSRVGAAPTATPSRSVEMPVVSSPAPLADKDSEVAPLRENYTSAYPDAHDADGWCVLLIEDDPFVRTGLELFLGSHGYRVYAASSGNEGFRLVEDGIAPDAIVSDYNLAAAENGLEVIKRLWSVIGSQIPAMILSGHLERTLVREISSLGIKVAQKPLPPSDLSALIRAMVK
jgi:CheY-like chemotaxis protein